jgi:hypothetical protein
MEDSEVDDVVGLSEEGIKFTCLHFEVDTG